MRKSPWLLLVFMLLGGLLGVCAGRQHQRGQDEDQKRPPRTIGHARRLTCPDSQSSCRRRALRACR